MKRFNFKHLALFTLVMPLAMTSCSDNEISPRQEGITAALYKDTVLITDTLNSELKLMAERQIVVERVRDIFGMVRDYQLKSGALSPGDLFDKTFCSKSWNKMLMAMRNKEYQTNTLFFEIDHWKMSREVGLVTFDEFECTRLAVDDTRKYATVDFLVYELDNYAPARVDMVYEDGRWVIDNFYDMRFGVNIRNSMAEYIVADVL